MYIDTEMILIFATAVLSGIVFYGIAARDPRQDGHGEPQPNLCDSSR